MADAVPLPKGSPSSDVGDYRPISITSVLSKVFEKIVAGKLSHYLENNSLFPPSQFSYRRGQGTCDALLTLSHHLQVALDRGMEGRLVQLSVSAAFDRVSHRGQLCKLRSMGVGGQFLSAVSVFLSDRRQRLLLDEKVGESVDVVTGVPQGSVLGPLLFILCTFELFHIVENFLSSGVCRGGILSSVKSAVNLCLLRA